MAYKISADSWHYKWHNAVERGWNKLFKTTVSAERMNLCPYLRTVLIKPFILAFWWVMKYPLIGALWLLLAMIVIGLVIGAGKIGIAMLSQPEKTAVLLGIIAAIALVLYLLSKLELYIRSLRKVKTKALVSKTKPAKVKKVKKDTGPGLIKLSWQYVRDWHNGICQPIEVV